ncbi:tRNA pseudouridine(54/55) synthase Pus10 [Caldiplasma sukawensis]
MSLEEILNFFKNNKLCKNCIGHFFSQLGEKMTNEERADHILFTFKALFGLEINVDTEECTYCNGLFSKVNWYTDYLIEMSSEYEFRNFLVGTTLSEEISKREEMARKIFGNDFEPINRSFNRLLGKKLEERTGKIMERNDPEIMFKLNLNYDSLELQIRPVYIYGIYWKFRRDIPQTKWIKPNEIKDTVESIIGEPINAELHGDGYTLHGSGREDVDVRMLGNGREFVIEIKNPRKRSVPLEKIQDFVNSNNSGVKVELLSYCTRKDIIKVKNSRNQKVYNAKIVRVDGDNISRELLENAVRNLNGKIIYQRTPLRVAHSRTDMIRERKVIRAEIEDIQEKFAMLKIETEAGTYIKELISGDDGRTTPSLSELYGSGLVIKELDVIEIKR